MRRSTTRLVFVAAALLALGGGCSLGKGRQVYRDVTGRPDRATVELNTASRTELAKLPGLTDEDADRIIQNRPYGSKDGLLRKKVLGKSKFEKIQDYVYVAHAGQY